VRPRLRRLCPSSVRVQDRIGLKRAGCEFQTLLIFRILFLPEAPYFGLRIRCRKAWGFKSPLSHHNHLCPRVSRAKPIGEIFLGLIGVAEQTHITRCLSHREVHPSSHHARKAGRPLGQQLSCLFKMRIGSDRLAEPYVSV